MKTVDNLAADLGKPAKSMLNLAVMTPGKALVDMFSGTSPIPGIRDSVRTTDLDLLSTPKNVISSLLGGMTRATGRAVKGLLRNTPVPLFRTQK